MKYNPKVNEDAANLPGFQALHPLQPPETAQGILELMHETLELLCRITGMSWGTLQPLAGAQGEFTGLKLFRALFQKRGEEGRSKILVPASARLAGFEVVEIKSNEQGIVCPGSLREHLDGRLAGIMLTNPNTLGKTRPGDMGFDVVHLNLHKTFSTPHGGGGPGSGPVLVKRDLVPFLPAPDIVGGDGGYRLDFDRPESIGRVAAFYGNIAVVIKAYAYLLVMGGKGLEEVAERAVLNANYLKEKLKSRYPLPYDRPCMHEFVLSAGQLKESRGVSALDVAKRLLD